jgi:hypothetical protein
MILLRGTRKQGYSVQIVLFFSTLRVTVFYYVLPIYIVGAESFLSITGLKKIIKNSLVIREMLYLKLFSSLSMWRKRARANPF